MSEFTFKNYNYDREGSWLKAKDLKEGHVYIIRDGRIALYIGKTTTGLFCFYNFCAAIFKNISGKRVLSFSNYDVQLNSIVNLCNSMMQMKIYPESVIELKGIPKIYCEFPFVNYEAVYKKWYVKSTMMLGGNLPQIASIAGVVPNAGFVSAKDLVPGHLYYSGSCWRSTFVYLGRDLNNNFVWYFISNESMLLHSSARQLVLKAEATKSNKKVKPLAQALTDCHAYVSDECRKLIEMNYTVDMTGISRDILSWRD